MAVLSATRKQPQGTHLVRALRREAPGEVEQVVPLFFLHVVTLYVARRVQFLTNRQENISSGT